MRLDQNPDAIDAAEAAVRAMLAGQGIEVSANSERAIGQAVLTAVLPLVGQERQQEV